MKEAQDMDAAIAAFVAASAALEVAEKATRDHASLSGGDIGTRTGRNDAAAHGQTIAAPRLC